MEFPDADQPKIILAHIKDQEYKLLLKEKFYDTIKTFFGVGWFMKVEKELSLISDLLYFSLTTGINNQTPGEEYAQIYQINTIKESPRLIQRLLLIVFHVFIPYSMIKFRIPIKQFLMKINEILKNRLFGRNEPQFMRISTKWSEFLQNNFWFTHLMLFYFHGQYYHLSKRILGVKYVGASDPDLVILGRPRKKNEQTMSFEILGTLMFIELMIKTYQNLKSDPSQLEQTTQHVSTQEELISKNEHVEENIPTCTLCLGPRQFTTATSCGHLFCWYCIADWLRNKSECPLCRASTHSSTLCVVYNF